MTSDDQERIVGPRRIYSGVGVKVKVLAKGYLSKAPWVEEVEDSSNERAEIVVVRQDVQCKRRYFVIIRPGSPAVSC